MHQYRVGLIGLGAIASGYGSPDETAPYCHAGGLAQSDRVQLVAVADPFELAHTKFQEKWEPLIEQKSGSIAHYTDAQTMLENERLDIVGVCVRGPMHYDTMKSLLNSSYCPRAIFLEKPPFSSLQEADEIVALAAGQDICLTISYSRHWAPHVLKLEELVREGLIGQVHSVVGYCGGTILSFASHTTDLICQFACAQTGSYHPLAVTATGDNLKVLEVPQEFAHRGYEPEPSLQSLFIEFENDTKGLQVGAAGEYGAFYVDVFGDKGRVRAGIYIEPAAFDSENNSIDLAPYNFPSNTSVFHRAYDQIADYLSGGNLPDCSGHNWQQVNDIGFAAIESLSGAGRVELPLPISHRMRRIFANG